jgi:hypothetical protein
MGGWPEIRAAARIARIFAMNPLHVLDLPAGDFEILSACADAADRQRDQEVSRG